MARQNAAGLLIAIIAVAAAALSGCFGGHEGSTQALHARTTNTRVKAHVRVERIVYSSSHGRRVPALFAMPRGVSPRGCLIWENGLNSRKEDSAEIWDQAARLGLAVFSIDFRHHGERGSGPKEVGSAIADPNRLAALVRGSVADLRHGVDYLERRRECRKNVGYGGLSLGGAIGSVLAGRDPRIRATVIMSSPPTWRSVIAGSDLVLPGVEKSPRRLRRADQILSPLDPVRWIKRISPRPVIVLIGRSDPGMPARAAAQMESAARAPKRIITYRGGHVPSSGPDAARNASLITNFLLRWLVKPTYPP